MVDLEAFTPQRLIQQRTPPTPLLLGQCAQPLAQFVVAIRSRFIRQCASCDPDQPAGATL